MKNALTTTLLLSLLSPAALADEQAPRALLDSLLQDRDGEVSRVALALLGDRGGDSLFYLPTRDQPQTPARWNFAFEDVAFKSADGTPLHGWFLPARGANPKATVVFSHGNSGSLGHHLGFSMWLVEAGYHVFMYDYRGFGKSGGTVDRRGMIEDVQAAFRYVATRRDVDAGCLVSFGHSMGGAKSITALAEARPDGLRAVITDGTFACYQDMARIFAGDLGRNITTNQWSPVAHVADLAPVPLLIVHGTNDEVVPFSQGNRLHEAAAEPKTLFKVEQGRHGDALTRDQGAYRRKTLAWLAQVLAK
jgi:fermentation-respiration switch protein FrsA (DUF1100 family)